MFGKSRKKPDYENNFNIFTFIESKSVHYIFNSVILHCFLLWLKEISNSGKKQIGLKKI